MGFINIFVGKESRLKVKNGQLYLNDCEYAPVEDVNCLMIDDLRTSISTYALNALTQAGATVILCDEKHTPSCTLLPYGSYYRRLPILQAQAALSKPRQKQLWKQIVQAKINNQAFCLQFCGKEDVAEHLFALSKKVVSNDAENREAESARLYFPALFGEGFTRGEENGINGALNYGYAIVRSLVARHLAARGLECAYGLFHHSQLNAFNLADDFIEPFRPVVDCFVFANGGEWLDAAQKRKLFAVVDVDVLIHGGKYTLSTAIEMMAESFLSCLKGESATLQLPQLIGITTHDYE